MGGCSSSNKESQSDEISALHSKGKHLCMSGDVTRGRRMLEEAYRRVLREGNDRKLLVTCCQDLGYIMRYIGEHQRAVQLYKEAATILEMTDPNSSRLAECYHFIAVNLSIETRNGPIDVQRALWYEERAIRMHQLTQTRDPIALNESLASLDLIKRLL